MSYPTPTEPGWYLVQWFWIEHAVEIYESATGLRVRKTTFKGDRNRTPKLEEFDHPELKWKEMTAKQ